MPEIPGHFRNLINMDNLLFNLYLFHERKGVTYLVNWVWYFTQGRVIIGFINNNKLHFIPNSPQTDFITKNNKTSNQIYSGIPDYSRFSKLLLRDQTNNSYEIYW